MADITKLANDFNRLFQKEMSSTLDKIADELIIEVQQNIESEVYSVYDPTVYQRTYKLKKSISKSKVYKSNKDLSINVYADDKIAKSHHMYKENGKLEPYAEVVETGQGYDFGFPYRGKPRNYMEKTYEQDADIIADIITDAIKNVINKL